MLEVPEQPPTIEDPEFNSAVERYMEWYKANREENSYKRHSYAKKPLTAFFGNKRLSEIAAFDVEKYKLTRRAAKKGHGTINRELALLRNLYTKSIEWKLAETNPTTKVPDFKESEGRNRYLSEEEGAKVLANCKPKLRLLVLAALHTGFRTSELKETTWGRVDFLNKFITVPSCYAKNDATRTVPMHPDLATELRAVYDERRPKSDDHVFLSDRHGKPYKSWRTAFKTALKKAGITDFVFHDLRHCFGSYLGMNNRTRRPCRNCWVIGGLR